MADIDIVPRKRSSTWIWILLVAIVLVVAVLWMMSGTPGTETQIGSTGPSGVWTAAEAAAARLVGYV